MIEWYDLVPKIGGYRIPYSKNIIDWEENCDFDLDLFVLVAAQLFPAAAADATCCPCCPMLTNIALSSSSSSPPEAASRLLPQQQSVCVREQLPCGPLLRHLFLKSWNSFYDCFPQWLQGQSCFYLWFLSKRERPHKSRLCVCVQLCIQEELPWVCWPLHSVLHTPPPRSYQAKNEVKPMNSEMKGSSKIIA